MIQLGECLSKRKDTNDLKIARTCIVFKISYETTTCTIRTNTHTHTHTHTHIYREQIVTHLRCVIIEPMCMQ